MSERTGVLGRLGVEASERAIFVWAGLCLVLVGAAAYAVLNTAETLFLKRVGVQYLPLALLATSGLLVATTGLVGRYLLRADRPSWLPRILLGLGFALLPFALLVRWDSAAIFAGLVVVSRHVLAVGLLTFWVALGDLVTGRQAKRLFAPLTAGITIGAIIGSFGTEPVARLLGVEGLLVCAALLLGGAALAAQRIRAARPRRLEVGAGDSARSLAPSGRRSRAGLASPRQLWRESRLFRLLLVALLCGGTLSPVLYFQFSYVADAATQGPGGEEALLALYAQFRGWLNVGMLGAQLWLSSRLYRKIGLPLSLAIWPATYLVGFSWLGAQLTLRPGMLSLGGSRVAEDGIAGAALRVLFNLFPERFRSQAASLLEGPVNRLGGVLGNSGVLLLLAFGSVHWVSYAATPVAALWLVSALILWRAYPTILLQASAQQNLAEAGDAQQLLDPGTVRALAPNLSDPDPSTVRVALDLFADADPALTVPYLAEALENSSAATRPLLVETLHRLVEPLAPGTLRNRRAVEALARTLANARTLPAEQRADLLQVYARLTGGPDPDTSSAGTLDSALGDREAAVRLAAIAELHRRGTPPPGVADLDTALAQALVAGDVLMRRTARKELRAMLLSTEPSTLWEDRLVLLTDRLAGRVDRAETAEALVEIARRHNGAALPSAEAVLMQVDDRDPRVRAASLSFLGHAGVSDEVARLTAALGSRVPEEARAARDALVALGPAAAPHLLVESEFGTPRQREAVISIMRELDVDPTTLVEHFLEQHRQVCELLVLHAALGVDHPAVLLVRRLEERVDEGVSALLSLLSVIHDDGRIAELDQRLRRTHEERRRDILIEALEALLTPEEGGRLVPLLESGPRELRQRYASERLGAAPPPPEAALRQLSEDADETTRRLAEAYAARLEAGGLIGDPSGVLDPMDVAVRLQSVTVFDRLSTRQLVRLAEHLEEERLEPNETVYAEGDEGTGLYFVLEGEVELRRSDRLVESVGPDRFFGELAALDGVPRPTTAVAATGLRVLRLAREDLLALMEEAPVLGVGLAQFLALRVRELQDRLQSAT